MVKEPYRIGFKDIKRERLEILTKTMRHLKKHKKRKEPVKIYYLYRMERMSAANSQHVYDLVRKRRKKKTGNEPREAVRAYFEKLAGGWLP